MHEDLVQVGVVLLIAALVCVVGCMVRKRLRCGKKKKERPVRETLELARNSGMAFVIRSGCGAAEQHVRGVCAAVEANSLCVDIGPGQSLQNWEGRSVNVHFCESRQATASFYTFRTSVLRVDTSAVGRLLELALPSSLTAVQRRRFLRLTPREDTILDSKLWFLPPHAVYGKSILNIPDADVDAEELHIANISAGGVSLELSASKLAAMDLTLARIRREAIQRATVAEEAIGHVAQNQLKIQEEIALINLELGTDTTGQTPQTRTFYQSARDVQMQPPTEGLSDDTSDIPPLLMRFVLRGMGNERPLTLWFMGKIVNRRKSAEDVALGICFLQWAQCEEEAFLPWLPVNPEVGVSTLEKWVTRRHHETYFKLG